MWYFGEWALDKCMNYCKVCDTCSKRNLFSLSVSRKDSHTEGRNNAFRNNVQKNETKDATQSVEIPRNNSEYAVEFVVVEDRFTPILEGEAAQKMDLGLFNDITFYTPTMLRQTSINQLRIRIFTDWLKKRLCLNTPTSSVAWAR